MTSWAFWVASGTYLFFSLGITALTKRLFKRENLSSVWYFLYFFGEPFVAWSFLAFVLWTLAANLMGSQVGLLTLPFSAVAKATPIVFGLLLLLCGAGKTSLGYVKNYGFLLAVVGTLLIAQLSIPERLLDKGISSPVKLYPGILSVSVCWLSAALISWLGVNVARQLCGEHESRRKLFEGAVGIISAFTSLCFLLEYARLAGV